MILTTDLGLQSITNAEAGGFLVDLTDFSVTEATDVQLSINDTALVGSPVFSAKIESIEVVSNSTIKLTLSIPPKVPQSGSWTLTEIGLFLKSGQLFAHGTFKAPFVKSAEFGLRIYIYVSAGRLGEFINVTFNNTSGLDSTSAVHNLVSPDKSNTNAVVVQDSMCFLTPNDPTQVNAGVALRYGAGGNNWAFTGHHLAYRGNPESVEAQTFVLNPGTRGGFWLNDQELVLIQIAAGADFGQSRRARYTKNNNTFKILDKDLKEYNVQSVLNIWRQDSTAIPNRPKELPEHFVLGIGKNTWKSELGISGNPTYDLVQKQFGLKSDGTALYTLSSSIPEQTLSDPTNFLVFVNGNRLNTGQYSITGTKLSLSVAPAIGVSIGVVCWNKIASTGSALVFSTAEYILSAAGQVLFQLSIVPDSADNIMAFVDGKFISNSHYTYSGTSLRFVDVLPVGILSIVCSAAYYEKGAESNLFQSVQSLTSGSSNITVPIDFFEKRNTLLTIDGLYVPKSLYTVSSRLISLNTPLAKNSEVEVFLTTSTSQVTLPVTKLSGVDTGPVWQDPAGVLLLPNKITPIVLQHVSNGGSSNYAIPKTVPSKDYLLVFVGSVFQRPETYSFNKTTDTLTLSTPAPAGHDIDIVCFCSVEDDGTRAQCHSFSFVTTAALSYPLNSTTAAMDSPATLVFLGGAYQHRSQYSISNNNLVFLTAPPRGLKVEVWNYDSIPEFGSISFFSETTNTLVSGKNTYDHVYTSAIADKSGNLQNSLVFLGSTYQGKETYSTTSPNIGPNTFTLNGDISKSAGLFMQTIVILTGPSNTRLITRLELESNYVSIAQLDRLVAAAVAKALGN